MIHPQDVGCKPTYYWRQSGRYKERCIRWYHCEAKPADVIVFSHWNGKNWVTAIECQTCKARWEG